MIGTPLWPAILLGFEAINSLMSTPHRAANGGPPEATPPANRGFLDETISVREILFILALVACLTPWVSPAIALVMGLVVAHRIGHPFMHMNHRLTHLLLQFSVVGLGFGMDLHSTLATGTQSMGYTALTVGIALLAGTLAGKLLGIDSKTAFLISGGTAICGGSAVATLAPTVQARENQTAAALGTIFILNGVALFIFPGIGHGLHLTQQQFGQWAAMAIHDTSSVLGAAGRYGPEALQIATTVKLARALWIIPAALGATLVYRKRGQGIKAPWFIGLFILAMALNTYLPLGNITPYIVHLAQTGLTITLFFIGAGLSRQVIAATGWKPLLQGAIVWIVAGAISLAIVLRDI